LLNHLESVSAEDLNINSEAQRVRAGMPGFCNDVVVSWASSTRRDWQCKTTLTAKHLKHLHQFFLGQHAAAATASHLALTKVLESPVVILWVIRQRSALETALVY
jgi:hypothetical protein